MDLTSKFSSSTNSPVDGKHSHQESPIEVTSVSITTQLEPLTRVLHCKGIVYSRLPYDTLWEYIIGEDDLNGCIADWISVGALLTAIETGRIREDGKEDKLIQRTPTNLGCTYAIIKLTELLIQWVSQGSDAKQTPRVLLIRDSNDEWCYPGCIYDLSEVDETTLQRNGCSHPHGYTLANYVTKQTGLRMSYADWLHINTVEDTAGHLGLAPDIPSRQPILQMVYCKEVLIATPRKPRSAESAKVVSLTSSSRDDHPDNSDDEESIED